MDLIPHTRSPAYKYTHIYAGKRQNLLGLNQAAIKYDPCPANPHRPASVQPRLIKGTGKLPECTWLCVDKGADRGSQHASWTVPRKEERGLLTETWRDKSRARSKKQVDLNFSKFERQHS